MYRIASIVALVAFGFFAAPALAQQETGAGQERTQDETAGQQGMTQDTAAAGQTGAGGQDTGEMGGGEMGAGEMGGGEMGGGEMPTTGSALPVVAVAGSLLVVLGIGLRYARKRS